MIIRSAVLSLALACVAGVAAADPLPRLIRVNLEIDNFLFGAFDPALRLGSLTGLAQFYQVVSTSSGDVFQPGPPHIDVGTIGPRGDFTTILNPDELCVVRGICQLAFSFSGAAADFPAFAVDSDQVQVPLPPKAPIIRVGVLNGGASQPPVERGGNILAFDNPVLDAGAWSVTFSFVPEPDAWALAVGGLAALAMLLRKRQSRRARAERPPSALRG